MNFNPEKKHKIEKKMNLIDDGTDSEDELPEGFEERVTSYGKVYYAK